MNNRSNGLPHPGKIRQTLFANSVSEIYVHIRVPVGNSWHGRLYSRPTAAEHYNPSLHLDMGDSVQDVVLDASTQQLYALVFKFDSHGGAAGDWHSITRIDTHTKKQHSLVSRQESVGWVDTLSTRFAALFSAHADTLYLSAMISPEIGFHEGAPARFYSYSLCAIDSCTSGPMMRRISDLPDIIA